MNAAVRTERVIDVRHWNESVFSVRITRDPALRFRNGSFLMVGLLVGGTPLMRAYSVASANHEHYLEFLGVKVPAGPRTLPLEGLLPGDEVLVSKTPGGSLLVDDLLPGRRLYLLATGSGLAPFLAIVKDPGLYERFEKVILVHGARRVSDLAYKDYLSKTINNDGYLGRALRDKFVYYPTVTREPFHRQGRVTTLIETGKLFADLSLPQLDVAYDRVMLCGRAEVLADLRALLDTRGFRVSPRSGKRGHYVVENGLGEHKRRALTPTFNGDRPGI